MLDSKIACVISLPNGSTKDLSKALLASLKSGSANSFLKSSNSMSSVVDSDLK